jgi:hypothetical protein
MVKALAEKLAEEDTRGSRPQIWISLGSEAEIVAESVTATRDPVTSLSLCPFCNFHM